MPHAASTRFLGFTVDQKLSWREHIDARCGAAKRLLFCCRRYLGLVWGVSGSRLASLYVAVAEPCLLYGCSLWCAAALTSRIRSTLRSVQRLLCIMCVRAFSTSPTLALNLLSRQIPVDYRIMELSVNCQVRIPPASFVPSTAKSVAGLANLLPQISNEVPSAIFLPNHPPWHPKELPKLTIVHGSIAGGALPLSTDGRALQFFISGTEQLAGVGCAVLILAREGVQDMVRIRLPSSCSALQAGGVTLRSALTYAMEHATSYVSVEMFSNCRPLFTRVLSNSKIAPLFRTCRSLILSMAIPVRLFLSRSQAEILIVSAISEEASALPNSFASHLDRPPLVRKSAMSKLSWSRWNDEWMSATTGSTTRLFFPTVPSYSSLQSNLPYQVSQLITGHCRLNFHQHRFAFIDSPACRCGAEEETIIHFLFFCPLFCIPRLPFKSACIRELSAWPPDLSLIPSCPQVWSHFVQFIVSSGRLDIGLSTRVPHLSP